MKIQSKRTLFLLEILNIHRFFQAIQPNQTYNKDASTVLFLPKPRYSFVLMDLTHSCFMVWDQNTVFQISIPR